MQQSLAISQAPVRGQVSLFLGMPFMYWMEIVSAFIEPYGFHVIRHTINSEQDSENSTDFVCIVSAFCITKKSPHSYSESVTTTEAKKCNYSYSTYVKWRSELDKECQTLSWLDCDLARKKRKDS